MAYWKLHAGIYRITHALEAKMEKSHQCLAQQMDRLEGQVVKGLDIIWKSQQQQQKAWESGGALDLSRDRGGRMGGEQGGSCGRVGTRTWK